MKEPNEYRDSGIKEPHKYRYFRTEDFNQYLCLLIKKLERDIQSGHNFRYLVIMDNFQKVLKQANYMLKELCI